MQYLLINYSRHNLFVYPPQSVALPLFEDMQLNNLPTLIVLDICLPRQWIGDNFVADVCLVGLVSTITNCLNLAPIRSVGHYLLTAS